MEYQSESGAENSLTKNQPIAPIATKDVTIINATIPQKSSRFIARHGRKIAWGAVVVLFVSFLSNLTDIPNNLKGIFGKERAVSTHQNTTFVSVNPQTRGDLIEGTQFTHKLLTDEIFPFGYAVIFFGEDKRFRYEIFKNGLLDWRVDWDQVQIQPDVSAGRVKFIIPATASGSGLTITNST
jgi:hypothetical protein